jgi:DNA repair exonuclease SbcCD nuclease subunit
LPFEPIRFIHASNLRLDSQLRGIGDCPDELRKVIESATITAFDRVIDACVSQRVDFALLTGDSFDERDRSLTARIALLDGFDRLNQHGIRIFVLPGRLDPADAWEAISEFPDNVTTFFDPSTEAVAVLRDGKVIASVACAESLGEEQPQHSAPHAQPTAAETRGPFRVGLCLATEKHDSPRSGPSLHPTHAFDYVAIGCSDVRETQYADWRIAHNPGAIQAICAADTGPHGCTLVEVAADGSIACQLIPTAVVRSENIAIGFDAGSSLTDLLERLRRLIGEQVFHPTELLWLVNWSVAGSGPLYETLYDDDSAREFLERVSEELQNDAPPQMLHSLRVLPDRVAVEQIRREQAWAGEYFNALDANVPLTHNSLRETLAGVSASSSDFSERMDRLVDGIDCRNILGRTRQYGITQFGQAANRDT